MSKSKPSSDNDSKADAFAAIAFIVLSVALAVAWVSAQ